MSIILDKKDNTLELYFNYFPQRIAKIKGVMGYKWDPLKKGFSTFT